MLREKQRQRDADYRAGAFDRRDRPRPPRPTPHPHPQDALFADVPYYRDLSPARRVQAFLSLPRREQEAGYARVRNYKRPLRRPVELRKGDIRAEDLLAIPGPVYFEKLAGIEVPDRGRVSCPLPEHPDRDPACQVYGDHRGWYCFVCARGGDILTLASALSGLRRDIEFVQLLEWTAERVAK